MDYLPQIKPRRKANTSLTYLDESDTLEDEEVAEIYGGTHRSVPSTGRYGRPRSADSSNSSSAGLRQSEVRLCEVRRFLLSQKN